MSLRQILFILVNYVDYDMLDNISQIMHVPDYIWNIFFIEKYKKLISSKYNAKKYQRNSLPISDFKRNYISKKLKDFDTRFIERIFKFKYNEFVFVTSSGDIYEFSNKELKLIDHYRIDLLIGKEKLCYRIEVDKQYHDIEDSDYTKIIFLVSVIIFVFYIIPIILYQ